MIKKPIRIAITGAAGQISYSLIFRIANGDMFGKDQPIFLHLLEVPEKKAQNALRGIMMEIEDCAFPLLVNMFAYDRPIAAFQEVDYAILIGSRPRGPNMERKDLLSINAEIFKEQGQALNAVAQRNVKVLVIGNPVNTNAYIAMKSATELPRKNFTAMLRLDYNRAISNIASKINHCISDIDKMIVWGNHSSTMYVDYRFATAKDQSIKQIINDEWWNENIFLKDIRKRGADIISVRGSSSAASAANAAIDHIRDWHCGSGEKWISMGVPSDGSYNIPVDIVYGFPVLCKNGEYSIIQNIDIDQFSRSFMDNTLKELIEEISMIQNLL